MKNNLQHSRVFMCVYNWSALWLFLDSQGRGFGCALIGLGKFGGLYRRSCKWDALSLEKGQVLTYS